MIAINYIQSFLENGLANARGSLFLGTVSANNTYKYDFETGQWVANSTGNMIYLDENGVANGLFKHKMNSNYANCQVLVSDADGKTVRRLYLPPWDDELFEAELATAMASLDSLNEKKSITEYWVGAEHEGANNPFDLTQELPPAGIALILKNSGSNFSTIKYLNSIGTPVTNVIVNGTFIPIFFDEQGRGILL